MTVTIKSMHVGQGVDYLLRTVAAGDGDRSLRDPLTRYYTEEGTPPGYWLGSGIASLDGGLKVGDEVAEEQLRRLIGHGQHPVTGEQLGSHFRTYAQPQMGKRRHAVAGFDMTFSIPKSASILWAVTDAGTQAIIADAHHRAVEETLDFVEREIIATRAGTKGPRGSVVQLDTTGVLATAFDHYDSRANDPPGQIRYEARTADGEFYDAAIITKNAQGKKKVVTVDEGGKQLAPAQGTDGDHGHEH